MILFSPISQFSLGPLSLHVWGLCIGIGFLGLVLFSMRNARRTGLDPQGAFWISVCGLIASIVGARIAFVLLFLPVFSTDLVASLKIWQGGLVISVGLVLGVVTSVIASKRVYRGIKFARIADLFPEGLAAIAASSRLGSFLVGDTVGSITELPWSVVFLGSSRHPLGVYQALGMTALAIVFLTRFRLEKMNATRPHGLRFLIFLFLFCTISFVLDWFQARDLFESAPRFLHLSLAQVLFLGGALFTSSGMIYMYYQRHD